MKVLIFFFFLMSGTTFAQTMPDAEMQSNCAHLEMSQELAKRSVADADREVRKQARQQLSRIRQCVEREIMQELSKGKHDPAKAHWVAEAAYASANSVATDQEADKKLECNYLIIALQHEMHLPALKQFASKGCTWGIYDQPKWISPMLK